MHRPHRLEFRYHTCKTTLPNAIVGDILPKMSEAVVFTVIDPKEGLWHGKLDKNSSLHHILGWATFGRYRSTSLPFELS